MDERDVYDRKSIFSVVENYDKDNPEKLVLKRIFDIVEGEIEDFKIQNDDKKFESRILFNLWPNQQQKCLDFTFFQGGIGVFSWQSITNERNAEIAMITAYHRLETKNFCEVLKKDKEILRATEQEIRNVVAAQVKKLTTKTELDKIGITLKEHRQTLQNFLEGLRTGDFYEAIGAKCNCTREEAKKQVFQYIDMVNSYIDGLDVETEVLAYLVEQNSVLREKYKTLIQEQWDRENHETVENQSKLIVEIGTLDARKEALQQEIFKAERALQKALANQETQVKIGNMTVENIQKKIQMARGDIADFLAEFSMYLPMGNQAWQPEFLEKPEEKRSCKQLESREALLELLERNLEKAGVDIDYTEALARYLYANGTNPQGSSLVVAGPGGSAIAQAYSCGCFGQEPAVLICDGPWNQEMVDHILASSYQVVLVQNPFHGPWIDRLPEYIFASNKTFFLVTPFQEDLLVEPQSLYQYVLPLFTLNFMDGKAQGNYEFGEPVFQDGVKAPQGYDGQDVEDMTTGILKQRVRQCLGRFKELQTDNFKDYAKDYCFTPLKTVTGKE